MKQPSSAMMATINTELAGVNAGDAAMLKSVYAPNAVIIDECAPYQWSGPSAPAQWLADFGTFSKTKFTNPHGTLPSPQYWDMHGNRAYVVVPVIFTAAMNGKPVSESGTWTFVLVKTAGGWKALSSAWGITLQTGP